MWELAEPSPACTRFFSFAYPKHVHEINLTEHQSSTPLTLSPAERKTLLREQRTLGLSIEPADDGEQWVLRPGSTVGAIEVDGLSLLIEPKIGIPQLLSLACYAIGPVKFQQTDFDFPKASALPDFLALALVRAARQAFSRGLLHGYRTEEEALLTVRGRIRFDEQLRRRPGMLLPIEVRYDEFTDDILANQLVKAAAFRLGRTPLRSADARRGIGWIAAMLDNVSLCEWSSRSVPELPFDRLNEHYRSVVALARLILSRGEFESRRGEVRTSGFLMDMNQVFQEFVTVALREALGLSADAFKESYIDSLDEPPPYREGRVRLRPDLVWRNGPDTVFVGDAKYKNITGRPVPEDDLYQLLAYTTALDLPGGLLVYAQGEADERVYTVRNSGKRLEVAALDLSKDLDSVLTRINSLAEKARALRGETRRQHAA